MDSSKKLRLGVIGTCTRGQLSDLAHRPNEGIEVVAGAEPVSRNAESFKKRHLDKFNHEVKVYPDYRQMIEEEGLDGVFVTAPDFLHEEMACFCLEHKVPVYLEKPIAISIEGADRILRTAKENRTRLMLGHNMRYMDFTIKMRELVQSGIIGDVKAIWCRHFVSYGGDAYFQDWHADRTKTCSLLLQKGAHDIDIIHWIAGSYTKRVNGIGSMAVYAHLPRRKELDPGWISVSERWSNSRWPAETLKDWNPVITNEDINMVNLQLANGVQACYLQCHFTPDSCRNYTIIGTKGRIENIGDTHEGSTVEVWTRRLGYLRREGDITYRMPPPGEGHGGADIRIVQDFLDMLRGKEHTDSTPQAARYAVAAGVKGAESIRSNGMPQDIPDLDADLQDYNFAK